LPVYYPEEQGWVTCLEMKNFVFKEITFDGRQFYQVSYEWLELWKEGDGYTERDWWTFWGNLIPYGDDLVLAGGETIRDNARANKDTIVNSINSFRILNDGQPIFEEQTAPAPKINKEDVEKIFSKSKLTGIEQSNSNKETKRGKVPDWIKNTAKWWSEGKINNDDFISGVEYMIKNKIIDIPELSGTQDTQNSKDAIKSKFLTVNAKEFVRPETRGMTIEVVINGYFEDYTRGSTIQMIIELPNGKTEEQKLYASKGKYSTRYFIDRDTPAGEYKITTFYKDAKDMITVNVIDRANFAPTTDASKTSSKTTTEGIPDWVKSNAQWWANGLISEDEFVNAMKYLVEQGVIKV